MRAVNLLTPDQRSAPKGKSPERPAVLDAPGGIAAFVLIGALALCVAGVAGLVLSNNVVKDRKAELAQVKLESTATVAQAAKLKPYADFQTIAPVFLLSATMVAPAPPGVTTTTSPSTSGDSA